MPHPECKIHDQWDFGPCGMSVACLVTMSSICGWPILNTLSNSNVQIPITVITGEQTNISPSSNFHFWQEVFVEVTRGG